MTPEEAGEWMAQYYQRPLPDPLVGVIKVLAEARVLRGQKVETGILGKLFGRTDPASIATWQPHTDASLIAFAAKVFDQNPSRIAGWLDELSGLTEGQKRSLWIAAWLSGVVGVDAVLRQQARQTSKAAVRFISALFSQSPRPIETLTLSGPVVLDMNWAAFFATGDERYVLRIIEALGLVASPEGTPAFAIGTSALWSLQSSARQHPRVRETCAAVLSRTTSGMRMMLESIVGDRAANPA
jgi:hypothetical protein